MFINMHAKMCPFLFNKYRSWCNTQKWFMYSKRLARIWFQAYSALASSGGKFTDLTCKYLPANVRFRLDAIMWSNYPLTTSSLPKTFNRQLPSGRQASGFRRQTGYCTRQFARNYPPACWEREPAIYVAKLVCLGAITLVRCSLGLSSCVVGLSSYSRSSPHFERFEDDV